MKQFVISLLISCVLMGIQQAKAVDVFESRRTAWAQKAEQLKPVLHETTYRPLYTVKSTKDPSAFQGWKMEKAGEMSDVYNNNFKEIKNVTVDFGKHLTGYYTFHLKTTTRTQDAPVRIKFTFGEVPAELNTAFDPYPGLLSRAWLQDEVVTVTQVDQDITIPRRIAFRYLKIELLGASPDFDFALSDMYFTAVSSAGDVKTELLPTTSKLIRDINNVGVETLRECMQTVYEDGPKRDSRLWIGDLYLESLANTYSFQNHDLTKRCLYLLASLAASDGTLHANVFEKPNPHPQYGAYCLSYNLLFNVALLEYAKTTNDLETSNDLWPVVKRQVEDAVSYLNKEYIFDRSHKGGYIWLFFDWRAGLDESTPMQGLTIFAINKSYELAKMIGKENEVSTWPLVAGKMAKASRNLLFDKNQGVFVSGTKSQVSALSQIWMILSGVVTQKESQKVLKKALAMENTIYPGSPYGYHYLIEALLECGMNKEAKEYMTNYWGKMVDKGADTFWEVWDSNDEYLSPYNFFPVNSYCHAWSCTPVYFIHKYPEVFQK